MARVPVTCIASGAVAYFDPVSHTYVDGFGESYLSGSTYAGLFGYKFNKQLQAPMSAKKLGVSADTVEKYWSSKGEIATSFGTALHNALEHYGKYKDLCEKDGKGTGIHPTLWPIVEAFFKDREHEVAYYEAFVSDELNLFCGFIDRLVITGPKRCIIEDYKTNGDLHKQGKPSKLKAPAEFLPNTPMGKYHLQLNFYRHILEEAGWTVEGLRVHWWSGKEWQTIELDRVEHMTPPTIAPEFDDGFDHNYLGIDKPGFDNE